MSSTGIQLSGLINGSFNWQSVVTQLVAIQSQPITGLQADEATNNSELAAYAQLTSDVSSLQTAAQALQPSSLFTGVAAASATPNSTWTTTAAAGTSPGSYTIAVSNLATASSLDGASDIGSPLSSTSDVSGVTLATMPTATAPTAGTFTVDGDQVTVALTDSLQQVLANIATATGGNVTGSYDPTADKITLKSADLSPIVLGASNDTSNLLSVLGLENNGADSVTSVSKLGAVSTTATLASAGLNTPVTGTTAGAGSFKINGVSISYNTGTDTISSVINDINNSTAGVTASYDPSKDRVILTNNSTGDIGIGVQDTSGTLMASLGLTTGATLQQGENAEFTVNGGGTITSLSNTLDPSATGIPGLTVGINSETTQTVTVSPDTSAMTSAIQSFITSYNTLQNDITAMTQITTNANGTVTTGLLSSNQEVPQWSEDLRNMAFNAVSGVSGTIKSLDALGIGFTGTSPTLSITDQATLTNALNTDPTDVASFFQTPETGFAAVFNNYLSALTFPNTGGIAIETNAINSKNTDDANQISQIQLQVTQYQSNLTAEFLAMQTAQAAAASEQQVLSEMFSGSSGTTSSGSSGSASVVPTSSSTSSTSGSTSTGSTSSTSSTSSSG
jgi:flagellar hook-associated protein 2